MKFAKKDRHITFKVSPENHDKAKKIAQDRGMTISGMIRYALKKVFGIDFNNL